jgi:putative SOS response-associated peptidase YedK
MQTLRAARDAEYHERMPVMLGWPSQTTRWQSERVS